ncbi:calmodulin-like protein 3 [Stylonychia lemnae]|uniref:Calmodulin-like protein 3 n=1 Tax=Stylonychia lemnae TaxID=5949 RepID=A0A078A7R4_STYLE|nr:calmodulin-like protein 3 [Stylonychia lemnae]|eukprot:CDW78300.1 calmodulin-like protein 3 [Stylonychia lemnae]
MDMLNNLAAQVNPIANLKMHVLLIVSNKEESKAAEKIYDPKFHKISTVMPDAKAKYPKDVHAIVAFCGKDDLTKIGTILDQYTKYSIKTIFGKQTEDVKNLESQDWKYFELSMKDDTSKFESLRSYLKQTFDKEVDNIKKIFESIDEDGNKFLSPFELTLVSQQLGKPMSKEEVEQCCKIIDSDGNGQITFDEFALWWIGGREGAPEGLGSQLATFMANTQKYTNLAMRQLNQTLKTTNNISVQDMRQFQVQLKMGKFEEENSGISLETQFSIIDSKSDPVLGIKENLGFTDKECWFMMRFYVDDDETPEQVAEKVKNYKVIKLLEKYVKIYNKARQGEAGAQQAKLQIKPDKKSIIIGIQGGHQLQYLKQSYISPFDPVLDKVIQLQKKSNTQNFYQSLTVVTELGTNLVELLANKSTIIDSLMKGVNFKVGFKLLSKMDDILLSIIQFYEEQAKKEKKDSGKKLDAADKVAEKQQRHFLHLMSVIIKSKLTASFELDYAESFQNNLLSWIDQQEMQAILNMVPQDALPFLSTLKEDFDQLQGKDGIPEVISSVKSLMESIFESIMIKEVLNGMIEFVNENIDDDDKDEEDEKYPENRVDEFIEEICQFTLECFDERMEIMFFFKNCCLSFNLLLKEFRRTLFALGKAYQKVNPASDDEGEDDY